MSRCVIRTQTGSLKVLMVSFIGINPILTVLNCLAVISELCVGL